MKSLIKRYTGLFHTAMLIAVPMVFASCAGAANILVGWEQDNGTYGYCTQAAPCITAPGVTGSNMTAILNGDIAPATGYDCCAIWSAHFFGNGGNVTFDLGMSASSSGTLAAISLDVFNNDCQTGGPVIQGCVPVVWEMSESINGGGYSTIGSFGSGLPGLFNNTTIGLNQTYNPGDTFAFRVQNLTQPGIVTGQFVFYNVDLLAPDAPEPSTWLMLGTALVGFAVLARRRRA